MGVVFRGEGWVLESHGYPGGDRSSRAWQPVEASSKHRNSRVQGGGDAGVLAASHLSALHLPSRRVRKVRMHHMVKRGTSQQASQCEHVRAILHAHLAQHCMQAGAAHLAERVVRLAALHLAHVNAHRADLQSLRAIVVKNMPIRCTWDGSGCPFLRSAGLMCSRSSQHDSMPPSHSAKCHMHEATHHGGHAAVGAKRHGLVGGGVLGVNQLL